MPFWGCMYHLQATGVGQHLHRMLYQSRRGRDWLSHEQLLDYPAVAKWISGFPDHAESLRLRADEVLERRVPCLGFGVLHLGNPGRWHADLATGSSWNPRRFGLRLDFARPFEESDVKVPWELSRLQALYWLAQGWLLSGEERYLKALRQMLNDWRAANPVGLGVNWSCPMEVAIRSVNLVKALDIVWTELSNEERMDAVFLLERHAAFLRRHPEISDVNGNHYLADLAGLVQIGVAVRRWGSAAPWLRDEVDCLAKELRSQLHDDGVHHEKATGYHRLVLELIVGAVADLVRSDVPFPLSLRDDLERMAGFLRAIQNRDGTIPLIGDSDSGCVVMPGLEGSANAALLLALVDGLLFGEACSGSLQVHPAIAWYLGAPEKGRLPDLAGREPEPAIKVFPDGGYVVVRSGRGKVVSRFGAAGLSGRAPHDHSDLTSITSELGGLQTLIDSGSSTYTGSQERRAYEISAWAHNVVTVDRVDPMPTRLGSVMPVITPKVEGQLLNAVPGPAPAVLLSHGGFHSRLGVAYQRHIRLDEPGFTLTCSDQLDGSGSRFVESRFHFDPSWKDVVVDGLVATLAHEKGDYRLRIRVEASGFRLAVEETQLSQEYGRLEAGVRLRVLGDVQLPCSICCCFEVVVE